MKRVNTKDTKERKRKNSFVLGKLWCFFDVSFFHDFDFEFLRVMETLHKFQNVIPVKTGLQVFQRHLVPRFRGEDTYFSVS